jgi:radical SAM protein with 4Fe4S-binding SPASM domain
MGGKYIPGQVVWELTLRCNLNCIHCGSNAGKPRPDELTTEEGFRLIEDLNTIGSREICFMGGEPFLRKDWFELGKKVQETGIKLLFISNGFIINDKIISKLIGLQPYAVGVSLDGGTAETHDYIRGKKGSFDKVKEYIRLARKANLPVSVITTVSKINFSELPIIKDYLLEQGNVAWQIQMAAPEGRFSVDHAISEEEYYATGLFIANLKKTYSRKELPVIGAHCFGYYSSKIPSLGLYPNWVGCQAGISILSIKSNGDVTGCLSQQNYYPEGNIRKKSISEIWNDTNAFAYNRRFTKDMLGENCKTCKYAEACRGGCLGNSLSFTGKPHNDPYCFHRMEQEFDK